MFRYNQPILILLLWDNVDTWKKFIMDDNNRSWVLTATWSFHFETDDVIWWRHKCKIIVYLTIVMLWRIIHRVYEIFYWFAGGGFRCSSVLCLFDVRYIFVSRFCCCPLQFSIGVTYALKCHRDSLEMPNHDILSRQNWMWDATATSIHYLHHGHLLMSASSSQPVDM